MGYKALLILEKILMSLPHSFRKAFFSFLATIAYILTPKYRKVVSINLDFLFNNSMSQEEKKEITKYSFKNLMYNFLYLMEMRYMTKEEFKKIVKVKNFEVVQKALDSGRPIVYITPHYSIWEFAGASLSVYAKPATIVYKHLKNQEYEKWLLSARDHFGNKSIEKKNVLKKLIKIAKNNEAIGILIDTNIKKADGLEVEFFGKKIHQTPVPAFIARKFDAIIIPVLTRTQDDKTYEVTYYDPIEIQKTENEKEDILNLTQAQATWLEEVIREEPKFWFWLHRRFKNDYPEIYK
ncbi:MAG: lipid A biosynthesis acyltransferase [Epsilonproteobacteria bacterium]|nr:lipid A biosynthesis acyltransferase [Campylobacterota bacterium]